jgi:(p)ppGpp synthase/HD superfamily hydrolase
MTKQEQLVKAEQVARKAHEGQYRRDGITPYIKHVEAVVSRVSSVDEKIVAWLHDVVEDTSVTAKDLIEMGFDRALIDAVVLLTKTEGYDLQNYLEAIKRNPVAKAVKIADMRANLADTPTKKQRERYSNGILFLTT